MPLHWDCTPTNPMSPPTLSNFIPVSPGYGKEKTVTLQHRQRQSWQAPRDHFRLPLRDRVEQQQRGEWHRSPLLHRHPTQAGFGSNDIDFESAEFSRRFQLTSPDGRWAHGVLNPRTMEFVTRARRCTLCLSPPKGMGLMGKRDAVSMATTWARIAYVEAATATLTIPQAARGRTTKPPVSATTTECTRPVPTATAGHGSLDRGALGCVPNACQSCCHCHATTGTPGHLDLSRAPRSHRGHHIGNPRGDYGNDGASLPVLHAMREDGCSRACECHAHQRWCLSL